MTVIDVILDQLRCSDTMNRRNADFHVSRAQQHIEKNEAKQPIKDQPATNQNQSHSLGGARFLDFAAGNSVSFCRVLLVSQIFKKS